MSVLTMKLPYHPPFAWNEMLGFLQRRAIPQVEQVVEGCYRRAVSIDGHAGQIRVDNLTGDSAVQVQCDPALKAHSAHVRARLQSLFDLHADSTSIDRELGRDKTLEPMVLRNPGLRVPGSFDGFELAWRAVLGQQVSVTGATTIAGRFVKMFGREWPSMHPGLSMLTPLAGDVAQSTPETIASIGIPLTRARTLHQLAILLREHPHLIQVDADSVETAKKLMAISGIGPWTTNYILMRGLHRSDAIPVSDLGLKKALRTSNPAEVEEAAKKWGPWQSYAAMHLWHSL